MKLPRDFYRPLAVGAPAPDSGAAGAVGAHDPFRPAPYRKVRAKIGDLAASVDVVLGNLEDAIPLDAKEAARSGFVQMAQALRGVDVGVWTRVNALNSPMVSR